MHIIAYGLMLLSGLLGLGVALLGCVLGGMLRSSIYQSDKVVGWVMIVLSLVYLVHPALSYWLIKNAHVTVSLIVSVMMIVLSVGSLFILPSAMDAAARP